MKLAFSGCSRAGLRDTNEDSILMRACDTGALFLVADGIGGRAHGEVVSGLLRDRYDQWWENRFLPENQAMEFPTALDGIKNVLIQVNREVVERYGELTAGSTLALLLLFRGGSLCLSVGDSRIYYARRFSFRQLTLDDISENLNRRARNFTPSSGGKLVGAVGIHAEPEFSIRTDVIRGSSSFLLCSDGVYRFVDSRNLRKMMLFSRADPEHLVENLSEKIERNGAKDNYSMIYIRVKETLI